MTIKKFLPWCFLAIAPGLVFCQETMVRGKVTDAATGDPIPFANVYFKGTQIGMTTDFDGNYLIKTSNPTDSVVATYVGYKIKVKSVKKGESQQISFQLEEDIINLQEVVVRAGENPAFDILRNVIRNKNENDKRKLTAYEYDTYTKIEVDVDNISDKLRGTRVMKQISQVMDSVDRVAGEDGKPILPLFITESVSKVYYRDDPSLKKELLLKTKINGVGVEDGTMVTQLIGSSFQEYNFYQNWLNIVTKEFISPIADGWRLYYEYDLTDSLDVNGHYCYRLDFFPKSVQDLAFTGTMWITKENYALKQIDATVSKFANVNFIEKIKIQQELEPTDSGAWLPSKNRIMIDVGEVTKNSAGMLAKFYTSNKSVVVNKPYNQKFYEKPIELAEDILMYEDEKYWDTLRHEPLSETEKNVYKMIDTLRNIPVIKTYTDIIKAVLDGYVKAGKYEIGPYLGFITWNSIEGPRLMFGAKNNIELSKRWIFSSQLGYGFKDERFKYYASATRIISRQKWTTLSFRARKDLARIGVDDETLADNPLFLTSTRWGIIRRGYYFDEYRISFQREFFKGFSQKVTARYWTYDPVFNFGYYEKPSNTILNTFQVSEVSLESRFARDEVFLQNDNERISLGATKWPIITLRYTRGIKSAFGSDFDFDKVRLSIDKRMKTGPLGVAYITITGEYIFNTLPYPMLSPHLGNQSPIYSSVTYNLMNYGEFVSDHFIAIKYRQYFEGLFLNRIPLIKRLNWRMLGTANVISGGIRAANRNLNSLVTATGDPTLPVGFFTRQPYIELGYGVENIFRFLRVDFVHRLSYLNKPDVRKFGVLFIAQFQL